jgi:hypothetical protein
VKGAVPYSIEDKVGSDVVASWGGRHSEGKTAGGRMYEILDTYLPHITRVGPFEFQDRRTGEVLSYIDAVEQNLDNLPKEFGAQVARPDWLEQRRRSIHCQLIETQRLVTLQKRDTRYWDDTRPAFIPAVNVLR